MTQIKTVCVDKVAYEAVLRNSIRVNDLEAENQQLKELLSECKPYISYSVNKKKYLGFTPQEANILTKINKVIGKK